MIKLFAFCFCVFLLFSAYSQEVYYDTNISGRYLSITGGISIGSIRDNSTSPLFYTGFLPSIGIKYDKYSEKNLWEINFASLNGMYLKMTDDDFYSSSANIFSFDLAWYRPIFVSDNYKHFLGGSVSNSTHIRINDAYMNAAVAMNNFSDLNLNYRFNLSFIRPEKSKKLLGLIKYTRKEKAYLFSAKAGMPIYTAYYRPGFTNPGNSTLNNDELFPGYKSGSKVFSGFNTELKINRILQNGNMFGFSYYWEMKTTGKSSINSIDIAGHSFLFNLVFKIN